MVLDERVGGQPSIPAKLVLWGLLCHDYMKDSPAARAWFVAAQTIGASAVVLPPLVARLVWGVGGLDVLAGVCIACMAYSNWNALIANVGFLYAVRAPATAGGGG